jgi:hypothetical protein
MKSGSEVIPLPQSKEFTNFTGGLRTGELLVEEGFLKEKDVRQALSIQQEEADLAKLPLGQI